MFSVNKSKNWPGERGGVGNRKEEEEEGGLNTLYV